MKTRRVQLGDGTKLGVDFSQRVWDALDRAAWRRKLPRLQRNYIRFQASDESIHDVPRRFISDALTIDQFRCHETGTTPNFRILDNTAIREHDRQVMRTLYGMCLAAQNIDITT